MAGFKNAENKAIKDGLKNGQSIADIAKELGRSETVVARQALRIKNKTLGKIQHHKPTTAVGNSISVIGQAPSQLSILDELQTTPTYRELVKQLTSAELRFYEENYLDLLSQFGENDTTKSEKLQIHKAVEYLIFMGRNKNEQLETLKQIDKLRTKMRNFELANPDDENWDEDKQRYFSNLEDKFNKLNKRRSELSTEYGNLENKNQELFNDLKATRTARLTSAEKRMSITDLVSELLQRDKRERVGRQAEMFKVFTDAHNKELTQFKKFADGGLDACILTPDSLELNDKEVEKLLEEEKLKEESLNNE